MIVIYNFLFLSALALSAPYWLWRAWKKRELNLIATRLGLSAWVEIPWVEIPNPKSQIPNPILWVHAVSVGEVQAAGPLLGALKRRAPEREILLSVTTKTGLEVARRLTADEKQIRGPVVFPIDTPWAVRRRIEETQPRAIVFMETELWPNLIRTAAARGTKLFLANGRISDRSFSNYRLAGWFLKPFLEHFCFFWMQSKLDADRIMELGAPADRVGVAGNLKIDAMLETLNKKFTVNMPDGLNGRPQLVAASTHAGEEEIVVRAAKAWKDQGRKFILMIAPRHPERARAVCRIVEDGGFRPVLRSSNLPVSGENNVLVIDTIGELLAFFPHARAVFVGGSLAPVGGHNIFEPAAFGRPVFFGPHMENFREARASLEGHGGVRVQAESFEKEVGSTLFDESRADQIGRAARETVESLKGSADRISRELIGFL